jgi:flagellar biosynthesis protein FlhF
MRIKSYYANSVEDGMAMARAELGPDAMLVNSRRTSPETGHLGEYEVVIVTDLAAAAEMASPPGAMPASGGPASRPAAGDRLAVEVAQLKKELEGMRRALTRTAFAPPEWRASPDISDAYASLAASELAPDLAREIVSAVHTRLAPPLATQARVPEPIDGARFQRALAEELESRIRVEPLLGRSEARPRIVALVGPPGAGKTTTLVKLAVNYGLASRRPVLLLSADTYRVAAAEQLRSFATILGVGFQVVETVAALAQAIEENRGKELIFIDTPGLAAGDVADFAGLAQFLSTRSDIDSQMVVSSSMKSADLSRVVDSFEAFRPQRLIFTKLDETGSFGPIFNESVRTGKPLSFFATGQRVPEDLEAASRSRLAELILGGQGSRAQSAA